MSLLINVNSMIINKIDNNELINDNKTIINNIKLIIQQIEKDLKNYLEFNEIGGEKEKLYINNICKILTNLKNVNSDINEKMKYIKLYYMKYNYYNEIDKYLINILN